MPPEEQSYTGGREPPRPESDICSRSICHPCNRPVVGIALEGPRNTGLYFRVEPQRRPGRQDIDEPK